MKTAMQHLAGYLPYKLKVMDDKPKVMNAYCGHSTNWCSIEYAIKMQRKPILHPLSDLTKEIDVNGKKFVPLSKMSYEIKQKHWHGGMIPIFNIILEKKVQLDDLEKLYEWHFDIHGLIENNLAIDINTIKPCQH